MKELIAVEYQFPSNKMDSFTEVKMSSTSTPSSIPHILVFFFNTFTGSITYPWASDPKAVL